MLNIHSNCQYQNSLNWNTSLSATEIKNTWKYFFCSKYYYLKWIHLLARTCNAFVLLDFSWYYITSLKFLLEPSRSIASLCQILTFRNSLTFSRGSLQCVLDLPLLLVSIKCSSSTFLVYVRLPVLLHTLPTWLAGLWCSLLYLYPQAFKPFNFM